MSPRHLPPSRRRGFRCPPAELRLYRAHTIGLLQRYFRMSIELGRLPSLIGREFFRCRFSALRAPAFEDAVIFVHDVDRCLERLDAFAQKLVARVVFQEYTCEDAAPLLGCARITVVRRYPEILDEISDQFLRLEIMPPLACHRPDDTAAESCQEPKSVTFPVSSTSQGK